MIIKNKDDHKVCDQKNRKYEICKGCASAYGSTLYGPKKKRRCYIQYPIMSPTKQCPCITCLLKNICHNSCEEYENYFELSEQKEKREFKENKNA